MLRKLKELVKTIFDISSYKVSDDFDTLDARISLLEERVQILEDENMEFINDICEVEQAIESINKKMNVVKPVTNDDWHDFWHNEDIRYTDEEINAMSDAAKEKERNQEYNLREAEYYAKRAKLDAFERSKYYWDKDRNK